MSTFVRLASLAAIPENSMRGVSHAGRQIAIYRVGGTLYATDDICTHAEARLSQGWLDPDDCTVECPLHGARFDIASGQAMTLPAYRPVAVYAVRVEGDDVLVELP